MKKILIVEDEEPIRRVLKRILADENPEFKISEAIDGNEAIEKLTKDKFDLVVCDIKMPKKDGLDVLKFANKKDIIIKPGKIETIPSGIKIVLKKNLEGQIRPRSGLAKKFGITVLNSPGTIDEDYRGEIKIILINHGKNNFVVQRSMRIAQLVISKVEKIVWNEKKKIKLNTKRNESGFGSTGL